MRYPRLAILLFVLGACGGGGSHPADAPPRPDGSQTPDGEDQPDAPLPPDAMLPAVVQCPTPVPAPTAGICDATAGAGSAVIVRGDVLADGTVYADGEIVYDGDRIACVACDCSATPGYSTATQIACAGAAISPGLINAHDHMSYDNAYPLASTAAGGTRYQHRHDWRGAVPTPTNAAGTSQTSAGMRWNELREIFAGTTSIAASTSATGLIRNLDHLESRDTSLGFQTVDYETFMLGDSNEQFHSNCTWNYAYSEFEVSQFPDVVTHTAEGINDYAHEEFRCQSRSNMGARDFTEHNVAHIHGIGLTAEDYFNMARDSAKLVWSPRSNISLYGNTADAPLFARLGGVVALGTDWTYSGSANVIREMQCAESLGTTAYGGAFSPEDIWKMATKNAAIATGTDGLIGALAADKVADIAVFRRGATPYYQSVIDATSADVALVVRAGDLLYSEADVATALGQSCDDVDVCGDIRKVCASRETGSTFTQIQTAIDAAPSPVYPAIFCDAPEDEPTCIPSRPGEYTAPASGDPDGDGIADADDNCPNAFNPIRPIDGGVQPDDDGDGMGDACDPTPLAADVDGDTIPNTSDNCPFDANTDQTDADGDNKGDACDPCPTTPNPIGVCGPAPVSVVDIQNGTIATGSPVEVTGLVITAKDSGGFYAQDPTVADGQYAGVYVFLSASSALPIGEVVDVQGTTDEYFGLTEIAGPATVVSHAAGSPLAPIAKTVAEAGSEVYEGVLVSLTDITKVDYPYDCVNDDPAATPPCADARLFELNDAVVAWDRFYTDGTTSWTNEATAAAADMTPTISGVMTWRYNRRRIVPRTGADITP